MRYPAMNNPPNAPELLLSRNLQWANHTIAATCDSTSVGCSTVSTHAAPRRTFFPPRPRSRLPQTPPLLLRKYLTNCPAVGPCARYCEHWHEQRLFGQLSEIVAVVRNLIDVSNHHCNGLYPSNVCRLTSAATQCSTSSPIYASAHLPSETVDSSEVECGAQLFQCDSPTAI